jgi:hypothetical protein
MHTLAHSLSQRGIYTLAPWRTQYNNISAAPLHRTSARRSRRQAAPRQPRLILIARQAGRRHAKQFSRAAKCLLPVSDASETHIKLGATWISYFYYVLAELKIQFAALKIAHANSTG